jgi:hypothetical protein
MNRKHGYDPIYTNSPLHHARKKTISLQVIEPVYVQLAADELVKKLSRVGIPEKTHGQFQLTMKLLVHSFHKEKRKTLMMHFLQQSFFQRM